MIDFRIVQAKTVLPVTSVSPVRFFSPPSVMVLGSSFDAAEEVLYNGFPCPEILIASSSRLLAKIPETQVGRAFLNIRVLASVPVPTKDAVLSLNLTPPLKTVSGLARLVQEFVLCFMTTPGSDIFDPNDGGGAQAVVGRPVSAGGQSAMADISLAVDRTKQLLMRVQSSLPTMPPTERLLSASLASIAYDDASTTLSAVVELRNVAGETSLVTVR